MSELTSQEQLKILSQFLTLQNILQSLPTEASIAQALSRALSGIPGVSSAFACFRSLDKPIPQLPDEICQNCIQAQREGIYPKVCPLEQKKGWHALTLKGLEQTYGVLVFQISQEKDFQFFKPYISNMAGAATLVLETHWQRTELEVVARNLRKIVKSDKMAQQIAHLGNWDWNIETDELIWSDEIYRIFGLEPQEFDANYETFLSYVHPEERQEVQDAVNACLAGEKPYTIEHRILLPDGRERVVSERGEVFCDRDGKPAHMIGTIHDITERKRIEEELQESEVQLRSITEHSPDHILSLNLDLKIEYANRPSPGLTLKELLGHSILDFLPDDEARIMVGGKLRSAISTAQPTTYQTLYPIPDDGEIVYESRVVPQVINGRVVRLTLTATEITERRRAEKALKQSKAEAEEANKAKSLFLANMSHEIRTPMNAIMGFAQILGTMVKDAKQQSYLSFIRSGGESLLNLINDILDLSKIESGKLTFSPRPTLVTEMLQEMEMMFGALAVDKGLQFKIIPPEPMPPMMLLDTGRMKQILINLLGNALKFTDEGSITTLIKWQPTEDETARLEIQVADTGIGVPEDQRELIFEAFEQQKGQSHAKYGGTGLGLAISRRLARMMGGDLSVSPNYLQGSVFRVWLEGVPIIAGSAQEAEGLFSEQDKFRFKAAKILVGDDVESNRKLIVSYLEGQPFDLVEAADGKEILEKAQAQKPDLILMDYKMPDMNGVEVALQLKERTLLNKIPIIMISASAMEEERKQCLEVVEAFLPKPVSQRQLFAEMKNYLESASP